MTARMTPSASTSAATTGRVRHALTRLRTAHIESSFTRERRTMLMAEQDRGRYVRPF